MAPGPAGAFSSLGTSLSNSPNIDVDRLDWRSGPGKQHQQLDVIGHVASQSHRDATADFEAFLADLRRWETDVVTVRCHPLEPQCNGDAFGFSVELKRGAP